MLEYRYVANRRDFETFLQEKCSSREIYSSIRVLVETPATIANLGPGFDILAVSLEAPRDVIEIEYFNKGSELEIISSGIEIPVHENIVYRIADIYHQVCGGGSLRIKLSKNIPVSRGLGSSGASVVGAVVGLSIVYGLRLSEGEIISLAGYGEGIIAGEPHYDNVSASLLGGLIVIDHEYSKILRIEIPLSMWIGVVIPNIPVPANKTLYARSVLPESLPRKQVIHQISLVSKIIIGVLRNDLRILGEAVSRDYVAEPYRGKLIPYYNEIKELALKKGAYGFNISGAGPSVFFIASKDEEARELALEISKYLRGRGVDNSFFVTKVSNRGALVKVIKYER